MSAQHSTELAVIPPQEKALDVFKADNGLDPYLAIIRKEIDGFTPDVSTAKGRKEIASIAHKIARSKSALDGMGKDLVAEMKLVPKRIDAERKRMRDTLDSWKEEVRAPLTEWEQAEEQRIAGHREAIDWFNHNVILAEDESAEMIGELLKHVEARKVDESFEEFEAEAHRAKEHAVTTMRVTLEKQQAHEAEQAELARLRAEAEERERKEREERIAREAEERARRQAEEQAKAEREAVARREQEAKDRHEREVREAREAAERREREHQQAIEQAKRDAEQAAQRERDRYEAEQRKQQEEAAKREADKEHRASVNRAAMEAFIENGMSEECAKQAVTLIAKRLIPGVTINY
ncbi:MAG: hypothetical protein VX796_05995 [Pseudomonadota bacterium]|nr:hypothetical protein [Pseudomonadota bacterium]